jgi:hypothetical protein
MHNRWICVAAVTVPPLALAALGITHPELLNESTAGWWVGIHIVLLPLFPLLAVAAWILLREDRSPLGWAGRVLALVFVPFYTALDAISGISAGTLQKVGGTAEQLNALFSTGRPLGQVGSYAFLATIVLILGSTWLAGQRSWLSWVAAVVLITAGYLFTTSHIYWPKGVIAMLGFAVGFFMLEAHRWVGPKVEEATPEVA